MKKNTYYLKATTAMLTILLFSACETGVNNKRVAKIDEGGEAPSGIVDKRNNNYTPSNDIYSSSSIKKSATHRIFSNSATPGYYVQVGFFQNNKPNTTFMRHLNQSGLPYTLLLKDGNYYALIGAYTSVNQAKKRIPSIKSSLAKKPFVVEVLRP